MGLAQKEALYQVITTFTYFTYGLPGTATRNDASHFPDKIIIIIIITQVNVYSAVIMT